MARGNLLDMSTVHDVIGKELQTWVAAKQAVRVAQNILRDDPEDPVLVSKLKQRQAVADEAGIALRMAMKAHGLSPQDLQRELQRAG